MEQHAYLRIRFFHREGLIYVSGHLNGERVSTSYRQQSKVYEFIANVDMNVLVWVDDSIMPQSRWLRAELGKLAHVTFV